MMLQRPRIQCNTLGHSMDRGGIVRILTGKKRSSPADFASFLKLVTFVMLLVDFVAAVLSHSSKSAWTGGEHTILGYHALHECSTVEQIYRGLEP
jgi:hypothetical protein